MSTTYANFCQQLEENFAQHHLSSKLHRVFRDSRFPNRFFILSAIGPGCGDNNYPVIKTLELQTQQYIHSCWGARLSSEYIYVDLIETTSTEMIIDDIENIPVDTFLSLDDAAVFRIERSCSDTQLLQLLTHFADESGTKLIHVTRDSFVFYDTSVALSPTYLCASSDNRHTNGSRANGYAQGILGTLLEEFTDCANMMVRANIMAATDEQQPRHCSGIARLPLFTLRIVPPEHWRRFSPVVFNANYKETASFNWQVANLLASYLTEQEHITLLRILQKETQEQPSPEIQTLLQKVFPTFAPDSGLCCQPPIQA